MAMRGGVHARHPLEPPAEYFESELLIEKGEVPEKGVFLQLKVVDEVDLEREVFRSEHATLRLPGAQVEHTAGVPRFTDLRSMLFELKDGVTTALSANQGPATAAASEAKMNLLKKLHAYCMASEPFIFSLDDPLGISYICARPDAASPTESEDPQLQVLEFERTWTQDTELGLVKVPGEDQLKGLDDVVEAIKKAKKIVFFTGAGVSTESGVPAFRNADVEFSETNSSWKKAPVSSAGNGGLDITQRWSKAELAGVKPTANALMYYDVVSTPTAVAKVTDEEKTVQAKDERAMAPIWKRFSPEDSVLSNIYKSAEVRFRYYDCKLQVHDIAATSLPNASHEVIGYLAKQGKVLRAVTQNIDGMLDRVGVPRELITELHGNLMIPPKCVKARRETDVDPVDFTFSPPGCGFEADWEKDVREVWKAGGDPHCPRCGGLILPQIVAFEQAMPQDQLDDARKAAEECDLMIVMGTSLVVAPANGIPEIVLERRKKEKNRGADELPVLTIINRGETKLDSYATILVDARCGESMSYIMNKLKNSDDTTSPVR